MSRCLMPPTLEQEQFLLKVLCPNRLPHRHASACAHAPSSARDRAYVPLVRSEWPLSTALMRSVSGAQLGGTAPALLSGYSHIGYSGYSHMGSGALLGGTAPAGHGLDGSRGQSVRSVLHDPIRRQRQGQDQGHQEDAKPGEQRHGVMRATRRYDMIWCCEPHVERAAWQSRGH